MLVQSLAASSSPFGRLLGQHQLYTRVLSGRLFFPPISFSEKDDVLDIGTGAGKPTPPRRSAPTHPPRQAPGSATHARTSPSPSSSTASTSNRASSQTTPASPPTSTSPSAPRPPSRPIGPPSSPSSTSACSSALTRSISGDAASTRCTACSRRAGMPS